MKCSTQSVEASGRECWCDLSAKRRTVATAWAPPISLGKKYSAKNSIQDFVRIAKGGAAEVALADVENLLSSSSTLTI